MKNLILSALALTMVFEVSAMASGKHLAKTKMQQTQSANSSSMKLSDKKAKLAAPVKKNGEEQKAKI